MNNAILWLALMLIFNTYGGELYKYFNETKTHKFIVNQFYERHLLMGVSKLGDYLYKNEKVPKLSEAKRNRTFFILIWKHLDKLLARHVFYFSRIIHDPLKSCSVKNCIFSGDDNALSTADAVVVHLHRGDIPSLKVRNPNQRWIFLNDESPSHVFTLAKKPVPLSDLVDVFNWSMSYMSKSDVPVPYGRTVALKKPKFLHKNTKIEDFVPNWRHKRRDVLVAILISNCGIPYRKELISGLKQYLKVNVHGRCGKGKLRKSCPGYFRNDCKVITRYLFYLALENSKCKEYITEKVFHNAYSKGAIPIIQGPSFEDCELFLPPNSYLHVDRYASLKDLAADIKRIAKDENALLSYHKWRNHFKVVGEHGYFGKKSFHLCRVCEAMNYNDDERTVYSEQMIDQFLNPSLLCRD